MKKFFIKEGKHSPIGLQFGLYFLPRKIVKKVRFTKSCKYILTQNKSQINKLFGLTRNIFSSSHGVSARFGWAGDKGIFTSLSEDEIMLYVYVHDKGDVRIEKELLKVKIEEEYSLTIEIHPFNYTFIVAKDGVVLAKETIKIRVKNEPLLTYRLYPFFGGKATAPQNIEIYLG